MGPFDYVLRDERELPTEKQTVWHLRTLTQGEYEEIERGAKLDHFEVHATTRKVLNFGLLGYTNFDGHPERVEAPRRAEGPRSVLTSECLDAIEPYAVELANAVTNRRALSAEARKN